MFPVFERFGGLEATLLVLKKRRGKTLTISAVRSWKEEGRVPAINRLPLEQEAAARGIQLVERDFLPTSPVQPRHRKRGPSRSRSTPAKVSRRIAPTPKSKRARKTARKRPG